MIFLRFGALLNHLEMFKDYAGIHYLKLQFFSVFLFTAYNASVD